MTEPQNSTKKYGCTYGLGPILIFTTNTHPCHRTERVMVGWWGTCSSGHILWFAKVRVTGRVLYPTLPYLRHTCTNWCPILPKQLPINPGFIRSCGIVFVFVPTFHIRGTHAIALALDFQKISLMIKVSAYGMPKIRLPEKHSKTYVWLCWIINGLRWVL